jgi:hypothetical protein
LVLVKQFVDGLSDDSAALPQSLNGFHGVLSPK